MTLAGGGKLVATARGLGRLYRAFGQRRLDALWDEMLRGHDDARALQERIALAVLRDGDEVAHAFASAARAAVECVDPSVLVSIGLLARRFITTETPARREYRAWLDMLERLDATEYGLLRSALRVLQDQSTAEHLFTTVMMEGGTAGDVIWCVGNTTIARGPRGAQVLSGFRRILEARGMSQADLIGGPEIPREVIELGIELVPAAR